MEVALSDLFHGNIFSLVLTILPQLIPLVSLLFQEHTTQISTFRLASGILFLTDDPLSSHSTYFMSLFSVNISVRPHLIYDLKFHPLNQNSIQLSYFISLYNFYIIYIFYLFDFLYAIAHVVVVCAAHEIHPSVNHLGKERIALPGPS